jgi:hypothetical protein
MVSGAVIYGFIKIGSGIKKLIDGGYIDTHIDSKVIS